MPTDETPLSGVRAQLAAIRAAFGTPAENRAADERAMREGHVYRAPEDEAEEQDQRIFEDRADGAPEDEDADSAWWEEEPELAPAV